MSLHFLIHAPLARSITYMQLDTFFLDNLVILFSQSKEKEILMIMWESKHLVTCRKSKCSLIYSCSLTRSIYLIYNFSFLTIVISICIQEWNFFCLSSIESGATISKNYDLNDLPGPPSKPQVTDVTKNSVTLSWQPGTPGTLPASSYIIEAFRYGRIPIFSIGFALAPMSSNLLLFNFKDVINQYILRIYFKFDFIQE